MRTIFIFYFSFILILFNISCSQNKVIEDGIYNSSNNDLYYAIKIDKNKNKILFYQLESYTEIDPTSKEIFNINSSNSKQSKKDFKFFHKGDFEIVNDKIIVTNLESDMLSSDRPKKIDGKISNDKIEFNCEEISKYFSGNAILCKSKEIVFIKN